MLQKIQFVFFFWQKRPKTIVIGIIVQDDRNSHKPASIHMTFYVKPSWACALFRNNKQHVGVWTRNTSFSSFQRSNWSPTYILHLFHLEDIALLFLFLSESVKVRFLPRVNTFSSDMLFIVPKQCACSRRLHIEGHMNRGGFNSRWSGKYFAW
jgi:hypothetical protein